MTIPPEELDEIERVAKAATQGEWWIDERNPLLVCAPDAEFPHLRWEVCRAEEDCADDDETRNALHIATFSPAKVLALIASHRSLETELSALKAELARAREGLEFYGREWSFASVVGKTIPTVALGVDAGTLARATLAALTPQARGEGE